MKIVLLTVGIILMFFGGIALLSYGIGLILIIPGFLLIRLINKMENKKHGFNKDILEVPVWLYRPNKEAINVLLTINPESKKVSFTNADKQIVADISLNTVDKIKTSRLYYLNSAYIYTKGEKWVISLDQGDTYLRKKQYIARMLIFGNLIAVASVYKSGSGSQEIFGLSSGATDYLHFWLRNNHIKQYRQIFCPSEDAVLALVLMLPSILIAWGFLAWLSN